MRRRRRPRALFRPPPKEHLEGALALGGEVETLGGTTLAGFDIGLPTATMAEAVDWLDRDVKAQWPDARVLCYGHIGDSNLHVVVNVPSAGAKQPHAEVDALLSAKLVTRGGKAAADQRECLIADEAFCDADDVDSTP